MQSYQNALLVLKFYQRVMLLRDFVDMTGTVLLAFQVLLFPEQ